MLPEIETLLRVFHWLAVGAGLWSGQLAFAFESETDPSALRGAGPGTSSCAEISICASCCVDAVPAHATASGNGTSAGLPRLENKSFQVPRSCPEFRSVEGSVLPFRVMFCRWLD